jgi:hypothetical protein
MYMTNWKMAAAALALLALVPARAAEATLAQYRGCDGYGEAGSYGDGMLQHPSGWAHLFVDAPLAANDRYTPHFGGLGINDCDAALAAIPAKHWMRRVSLISARAIHRIELSGDTKGALADLDLAVQTAGENGNGDAYYRRSLGWSLNVLRAYVLRQAGNQTEATALALAALAERPHNRQALLVVLHAMGPKADEAAIHTVQVSLARLIPAYSAVLFERAFETGKFAEAIDLYPQLVPSEELGAVHAAEGQQANLDWRNFRRAALFRASTGMAYVYALAALGRDGEARAALDGVRARLAADTAPPPPLSAKEQTDREKVSLHDGDIENRKRSAVEANKIIDQWAEYVALRLKISEGKTDEVIAALKTVQLPRSWASVELLEALAAKLPKAKQPMAPSTLALRAELGRTREDLKENKAADFFRDLPEVETADRLTAYTEQKGWLAGILLDGPVKRGFKVENSDPLGITPVHYSGGGATTAATVEEMALLRAAELARAAGKKGMVVAKRMDVERSLTTYYYSTPVNTMPTGFETELDVVFVDPANLPDAYKNAAWRVIDADQVYDALAPFYIRPKKK